ncbi:MAG TPA: UDP-N-acetylmuramoyl-tripeptide--D-alanyl-D-alanine ligase [Candidatus Limnocylindrales bacterium]|nr:UDP-N-acetylmuramoyl-tripeptide--D-alanyl-D-alanine ligase [Candidatus Limnocylindrales bacterium]
MTDPATPSAPFGAGADPRLTADDLVEATGGRLLARSSRPILGGAVDSREVVPGNLFVALPGERTDGHAFVSAALAAGAAAAIVSRPPDGVSLDDVDATIVQAPDALRALHAIAASWRRRFDPLVVGVTGSIAKTSTKEAIATVLASALITLKNEGNQNNEIGLPLTVLRLRPDHQAAVLEMGMYVGGEIAELAAIGRPEIGVVTAVQPVHLSRIGTIEAVEQAKGELVEALPPDGVAILNADDVRVRRMSSRTPARVVTYGFAPDATVRAEAVESAGADGMRFDLVADGSRRPVGIPTLGRLNVHNALAAAAVGLASGLSAERVASALALGWSAPHRGALIRLGGVTIVDDSYNASPGSVLAALDLLGGMPGRRIAVLGEMLELGDGHDAGHERVGAAAAPIVDRLVVVGGEGPAGIGRGARSSGLGDDAIVEAPDRRAALADLEATLEPGDVVLVKASRGVELDLLVDDLAAALERDPR